jgi:hypothetical protein
MIPGRPGAVNAGTGGLASISHCYGGGLRPSLKPLFAARLPYPFDPDPDGSRHPADAAAERRSAAAGFCQHRYAIKSNLYQFKIYAR